jgi:hypothetical protein
VCFEEPGSAHDLTQGLNCGIESLEMADLEHASAFPCGKDQSIGIIERMAYRFFDKDVRARAEKRLASLRMERRRCGDAYGIYLAYQLPVIREGTDRKRAGDLLRAAGMDIRNADQADAGH